MSSAARATEEGCLADFAAAAVEGQQHRNYCCDYICSQFGLKVCEPGNGHFIHTFSSHQINFPSSLLLPGKGSQNPPVSILC
jgi:hypothetical protein